MSKTVYAAPFSIGQRVHIDGCTDLKGTVTAILWRSAAVQQLEVSWIHNGSSMAAWVEPFRVTEAA